MNLGGEFSPEQRGKDDIVLYRIGAHAKMGVPSFTFLLNPGTTIVGLRLLISRPCTKKDAKDGTPA